MAVRREKEDKLMKDILGDAIDFLGPDGMETAVRSNGAGCTMKLVMSLISIPVTNLSSMACVLYARYFVKNHNTNFTLR